MEELDQNVDDDIVTIMEACKLAKVSRRTIYNWMAKGLLEINRTAGGSIRIKAASLFRPANENV